MRRYRRIAVDRHVRGYLHTFFQAGIDKDSSSRRGIDVVQDVQAPNCGGTGRERVLPGRS